MTHSLLPAVAASRFYRHWLQADSPARQNQLDTLSQHTLTSLDYDALLQNETHQEIPLIRALRRVRNLLIATIIHRDLSGMADLDEVVSTMTRFAEFAIRTSVAALYPELTALHGEPLGNQSGAPQSLIVLGMGKLGGGELNVSSDIDLIFVYPEDGETHATEGQRALSNHEFFARLGKRLIVALSDIVEDGFVFRVDMALRPNGASGPLVCSFNALEQYLVMHGREWERYAWIKARAITGNPADIAALEAMTMPFVYRRYLDFGAIDAIRDMHRQIRAEVQRQEKWHPDRSDNIKLGRGGIREIEFLVQVFQLIRGGRDAILRNRSTRAMLQLLVEKRQIESDVAVQLLEAYTFLRNLEHRLQYLDDAQTHILPPAEENREAVARMMGFSSVVQLLAQLQTYRTFVAAQFDAMFGQGDEPDSSSYQPIDDGQTEEEQFASLTDKLKTLGYPDATTSARRLAALWKAHRIRSLSDSNRARLATLVNQSLPLIASTCANPGDTLGRLLDFFDAIARRSSYLSLLTAYPGTIERLLRVMSASGWAAQYLSRHPILLDELLDARTLFSAPDWSAFTTELSNRLCQERGDVERQMDVLREMHHAMLFRLLAQDLEGMLSVERLADELSKLADTVVALTVQEAWLALSGRHADSPRFAVIAYGKLGGKELGYASDLDLVFLFDDDDERAPMLYARLVQRLTTWLSSPTSAGQLFEVDTALRPDGASGLPVTRLPAFEKYQMTSAWAWEHQALTRARFCAGDAAIGAGFEAIRSKVLRQTRDAAALRRDVLSMRKKMHDAHPNHSALFDVKHDSGGMIDIEFIVQYLVLAHAAVHPGLTDNIGNIALLAYCEQIGLIPEGEGKAVSDTYRYFRRLQHQLRMQGAPVSRVEREAVAEEIARVTSLWSFVFADDQGAGAAR